MKGTIRGIDKCLALFASLCAPGWTSQPSPGPSPQLPGKEYLYFDTAGGGFLYKMDLGNGSAVRQLTGVQNGVEVASYCTWHNRMFGVGRTPNNNPGVLFVFERDVGDGSYEILASLNQFFLAPNTIDVNPVTGRMYGIFDDILFEIDPDSGRLFTVGPITGALPGGLDAMGFSHDGTCYVPSGADGPTGQTIFYSINLQTAQASAIGGITFGPGSINDLAFDEHGDMWVSFDSGPPARSGFYKIDLMTMTAQRMFPDLWTETTSGAPVGIAFLRDSPSHQYCAPKTNSLGCAPVLAAEGIVSPYSRKGFQISATNVRNQTAGVLLYSAGGPTSVPFLGGNLCVTPPYQSSAIVSSGGSSLHHQDCSGRWEVDFNSILYGQSSWLPGMRVQAQFFGRDPGFDPPGAVALTQAVDFMLEP